jgi:hypothetical protein
MAAVDADFDDEQDERGKARQRRPGRILSADFFMTD